ncbi:MAG: 4-hydroxy-3-methylbut-2-enyl diphosphate reductase [bacterium]|nr:4-hydroxy-3-methylbut-2-enyl diphosphate reductase [bacterium]
MKRALNIINRLYEEQKQIHIYGQLIHNRSVLENLKTKGIDCIESLDDLNREKTLVVRTHGIPRDQEEFLKTENITLTDATCPLVKKLHHILADLDKTNTHCVIVGDKDHPEIRAAASYSTKTSVINSIAEAEADAPSHYGTLAVAAQTTLNTQHFKDIVSQLVDKADKLVIYNTICKATKVRQKAIKTLAPTVDCVIVAGGKNSSNTRKLYEIAKLENPNTFLIETANELKQPRIMEKLKHFHSAGITGGASTPPEELENIKDFLYNINSV